MNKPLYTGQILQEDEYLLKVTDDGTGFLTKLTQKGEIPKKFEEWGTDYSWNPRKAPIKTLPIYIHKEILGEGWTLKRWRIGQSQEWATMIHPEGWTVEIYLQNFLILAQNNTIINGVIQGEFKWSANILIK